MNEMADYITKRAAELRAAAQGDASEYGARATLAEAERLEAMIMGPAAKDANTRYGLRNVKFQGGGLKRVDGELWMKVLIVDAD